jgi:site-specific DNA-cytosine methylase
MKKTRVLGVAAGGGALLLPFLNDKTYKILGNVEPRAVFHTKKEENWRLNFGKIPFETAFFDLKKRPDIIVGSPDCGASSTMRLSKVKELGNPESNRTINLLIQAVLTYKPGIFLLENVPKLLNLMPIEVWKKIFKKYDLLFHNHSMLDLGNSQASRKRLLIIGIRKGSSKFNKENFQRIFQVNTPKVTRNLLEAPYFDGGNNNYMPPKNKILAMYDYRKLPEKENLTVKRIHYLWTHDFRSEKKWPIKTAKMSTLPGVYRLESDRPPLTVRPADRQFRPDGWPLGINDIRNIMGFPDTFKVYYDENDSIYWLNKARNVFAKGAVVETGIWFKRCLETN